MKRIQNILFVLGTAGLGLALSLGTAQAQVTSTGTNQGIVDLTLSGTIASSMVLSISGTGTTTLNVTGSNIMPNPSTATVDFGSFSTQTGFTGAANGRFVRPAGTAGAFLVAELNATATFSGNAGGASAANINLTLGAAGGSAPASPIAAGNTRVQVLPISWANATSGTVIDATNVSICPNTDPVSGNCASGVANLHELAVYIPDTQAAGNFTQVVRYTATAY